jgi:hypothetical protein
MEGKLEQVILMQSDVLCPGRYTTPKEGKTSRLYCVTTFAMHPSMTERTQGASRAAVAFGGPAGRVELCRSNRNHVT